MGSLYESVVEFRDAWQKFIESIRTVFVEVIKNFWRFIKEHLPAIRRVVLDYKKSEIRVKENLHIRSTWKVDWDTRKKSQVINNRPSFAVRKIISVR